MKNIELIININNNINIYKATIDNNIIKYEDNDSKVTMDINKDRLIRTSKEKYMVLDFKQELVHITIKDINYDISLKIEVKSIEKEDNYYKVLYVLENDEFNFELKIKE